MLPHSLGQAPERLETGRGGKLQPFRQGRCGIGKVVGLVYLSGLLLEQVGSLDGAVDVQQGL